MAVPAVPSGSSEPIWGFADHRFLSNFYPSEVVFEDASYPTVEHAYQAAKTLDPFARIGIQTLATPGRAKRAGRQLELRPGWDHLRLEVMFTLLSDKFTRHGDLAEMLCATGQRPIFEANHWGDTFWGVDAATGEGDNHLGRLLMLVRDQLRAAR